MYEMRNTIYHSAYFWNYIIEEKNSISDINILDYFVYENNCVIKSDYFKHFNLQNTKNIPFLNRNKEFKVVSN